MRWEPRYEEIREEWEDLPESEGVMGVIEAHGQTWSDGQTPGAVKMSTAEERGTWSVSGHWVSVVNHVTLITTEGAGGVIISTNGDAKHDD